MTKLVFIRHGESECNAKRMICAMGSDPNLTEEGINQAHQAGMLLREIYDINFNFMVISNLTRTNHTAKIINQHLNINEIYYDNDLRERGARYFGVKYFNKTGTLKEVDYDGFTAGDEDVETIFTPRVTEALCKYLNRPESLGLVVAHGNVGRAISSYFLEIEIKLENCEYFVIDPQQTSNFVEKCGAIEVECSMDHC